MEDDPKTGQPSTTRIDENITRVKQLVQSDRRLTVRMISDELSLNRESMQIILLHDLVVQKMCAKMPRCQRFCHKIRSRTESNFVKTCWRKLKMIQIFLGRSSQETKFGFSNMILKQRDKAVEDCRITQTQDDVHIKIKHQVILIAFFDQKGMVYHEFVPEGEKSESALLPEGSHLPP